MHIECGAFAYAHAQAFCAVMHKLVQLLRPEGDDTRLSEASHQQNGAQKARHNEAEREIKLQEVSEAQREMLAVTPASPTSVHDTSSVCSTGSFFLLSGYRNNRAGPGVLHWEAAVQVLHRWNP